MKKLEQQKKKLAKQNKNKKTSSIANEEITSPTFYKQETKSEDNIDQKQINIIPAVDEES